MSPKTLPGTRDFEWWGGGQGGAVEISVRQKNTALTRILSLWVPYGRGRDTLVFGVGLVGSLGPIVPKSWAERLN